MSSAYEIEFEHRVLYEQKALIEEEKQIHTKTYACSYLYPGAISRTTCRARTTLVYDCSVPGLIDVAGGTIEKWSEGGWNTIEEFFDTSLTFISSEEALDHMLKMFKSFILGINCLGDISSDSPAPPPPKPKPPKKDPFLRVLSFKGKVANEYVK